MFSGEDSIRIRSDLPREKLEDAVADALERLGDVKFSGRNNFRIRADRFNSSLANVTIEGDLTKGRKEGEWVLTVSYEVKPNALCWVVAILGFFCLLIGPLIFLSPNGTKNKIGREVSRGLRDAKDDIEEP